VPQGFPFNILKIGSFIIIILRVRLVGIYIQLVCENNIVELSHIWGDWLIQKADVMTDYGEMVDDFLESDLGHEET
jgi:hypothetical protein